MVLLIGNLTRDVTLRNTPSGQSVADFGLATNRTWVNGQGEKKQEAEFHNIVVWGKMADLCSRYLSKGSLVFIEGRIRTRSWIDQNGNKRYRTEMIAENVRFGPRRDQGLFPADRAAGRSHGRRLRGAAALGSSALRAPRPRRIHSRG